MIYLTTLYRKRSIKIENDKPTALNWELAEGSDLQTWGLEEPSKIFVPRGFTHIRCRASICFEASEGGVRQFYTRRNGFSDRKIGHGLGYLSATHPGGFANGSSVSFSGVSGTMPVKSGDFFELIAYQTSGKDLWVGGSETEDAFGCVFFEAEFINLY